METFEDMKLPKTLDMVFYAVLKTEGDLFVELQEYDYAIKVFKTLKDFINFWGHMDQLKIPVYEQIALCYCSVGMHHVEIYYLKKGLRYSIFKSDPQAELNFYDKLSLAYMNVGCP